MARKMSSHGCTVVVAGRKTNAEVDRLVEELGHDSCYLKCDVSQDEQCRNIVAEAVSKFGRLDHLVNSAGVNMGSIPHQDLEALENVKMRQVFDINVFGVLYMCRAAIPHLREGGGSIVNISSTAGLRCTGSSIPYSTSKAAVNHLTQLLAKSSGPRVRVNAVAPGYTETPLIQGPAFEATKKNVSEKCPLGRVGLPEEVADAVFALSQLEYVTGQVLSCDGGLQWAT